MGPNPHANQAFFGEGAVGLEASTALSVPCIAAAPEASVNQRAQTITSDANDSACFYILKASTALTMTGIKILDDTAVITCDYEPDHYEMPVFRRARR